VEGQTRIVETALSVVFRPSYGMSLAHASLGHPSNWRYVAAFSLRKIPYRHYGYDCEEYCENAYRSAVSIRILHFSSWNAR
jgi:hypothetical protein